MPIVLLLVGGLIAIKIAIRLEKTTQEVAGYWFAGIGVVTWVVGGIMVVILLFTYPISLGQVSDLENFHERNYDLFTGAVEEFPDAATVMTKEDTSTKQMLSYKFVQDVLEYNRELNWYRTNQEHWFIGPFVGRVSDELEFINR